MHDLTMPLIAAAALSLSSCTPQHPAIDPSPASDAVRHMPPPPLDLLVAQYLTLRHRITGESPWVVVCPPVELANMALWEDRLRRIRGEVKSFTSSPGCLFPDEARSDSVNPALAIMSVVHDGHRGTVQARRYSNTGPLREWTEDYQFVEMDERITIRNFPAVD